VTAESTRTSVGIVTQWQHSIIALHENTLKSQMSVGLQASVDPTYEEGFVVDWQR
jgi:hypothetical protein